MRIDEIMLTRITPYFESDTIDLVADRWRFRTLPVLPVLDAEGRLAGVVQLIDLLEVASSGKHSALAREVCHSPPAVGRPEMDVLTAVNLLRSNQLPALVVVDGAGKVLGVLRDIDALAAVAAGHLPVRDLLDLEVERVMTTDPATVGEDATVLDAAKILVDGGFRHLPVVDSDRRLLGIVSERDLRTVLGDLLEVAHVGEDELGDPISTLMASAPVAVRTGTRVADVIDTFTREKVGALPVIDDDDRVVGILSYIDLLRLLREPGRFSEKRESSL